MEKTADDLYFSVNRDLTLALAQAAKAAGVKQFIFLSTIKVYGKDFSEEPLTLQTPCIPNDPYGQSKWEAEEGLRKLEGGNFKIAIIRPPLIYGPGAKGNLLRLMQLVTSQKPVPLGGISNRRSMIFIDNLIDLIHQIIDKKASGTYLPADYPPISTFQMVKLMAKTLNADKTIITLPLPLRWIIKQLKPGFHQRLFGSLEVDSSESYHSLDFHPRYSQEEGIEQMAKAFNITNNLES